VFFQSPTKCPQALLVSKAQPRPWAYPAEHTTEMSPLKRISEQVREKYMGIGTEVPYVFKQRTRQIGFAPDGTLDIHHEIIVPKGSQKVRLVATRREGRCFGSG
jgi:GTPase Era involved in 16S rRNA processing